MNVLRSHPKKVSHLQPPSLLSNSDARLLCEGWCPDVGKEALLLLPLWGRWT